MVVARVVYGMLWAISTYVIVFYGEGNFSNLPDVTGNFDVGVKSIWSSRDQHVLCFYPISVKTGLLRRALVMPYNIFGDEETREAWAI